MIELLSLSIGVGLVAGLFFTEIFGIATGGLIVPGYMAIYLTRPWDVAATLAVSFGAFAAVRTLSTVVIIYGRRRTALMILFGYILGMLARNWLGLQGGDYTVIGFIIPGLIAIWMDRQGVFETLGSLLTVSVVVRLILILTVGAEMLP